ncbi:MAG: hypothetical protein IJ816_01820 [Alloprevotella sp.]|nr:hypothetical protein [Alloprevotella sp.]
MKKILFFILLSSCLVACMDDDNYLVSPTAAISIWKDTVSLDTVIANEVTPTDTFKIYNPHNQPIRFERIWLEGGVESPFRINVDGQSLSGGETLSNVEIGKRDSLIIFLFVRATDFDRDDAVKIIDKLHFLTEGGKEQHVVLKCYSQSVIPLEQLRVGNTQVLDASRPYHIKDSIVVEEGGQLLIQPGVTLLFHNDARLIVYGKLSLNGSVDENVVLRGDRLGNMLTDIPYDKIPNQWDGIYFRSTSTNNEIDYADIHSANVGVQIEGSDLSQQSLVLRNSIIHNTGSYGLLAKNANATVINTQITNSGNDCVKLLGGDYTFIHCTIAQFYPFVGGHGVAFDFSNYEDEERLPLVNLEVANTIVTGINADDLMGHQNNSRLEDAFEYKFTSCYLHTPRVSDDTHFVNCLWSEDNESRFAESENFTPQFDYDKLNFSFLLSEKSRAIGTANYDISINYAPVDRLGRSRLERSKSDIGCYVFQN